MRNTNKFKKGFTLIELLVVIAIIGILGSVVLVSLNAARGKAQDVRVVAEVKQIKTTFESNFFNGAYPDIAVGADNVASISGGPGEANILLLVNDIGVQNRHSPVTSDGADPSVPVFDIHSNGTALRTGPDAGDPTYLDTGVVVFTTDGTDYAIYATTTAGYVCTDHKGNFVQGGVGALLTAAPLDGDGHVVCQ